MERLNKYFSPENLNNIIDVKKERERIKSLNPEQLRTELDFQREKEQINRYIFHRDIFHRDRNPWNADRHAAQAGTIQGILLGELRRQDPDTFNNYVKFLTDSAKQGVAQPEVIPEPAPQPVKVWPRSHKLNKIRPKNRQKARYIPGRYHVSIQNKEGLTNTRFTTTEEQIKINEERARAAREAQSAAKPAPPVAAPEATPPVIPEPTPAKPPVIPEPTPTPQKPEKKPGLFSRAKKWFQDKVFMETLKV